MSHHRLLLPASCICTTAAIAVLFAALPARAANPAPPARAASPAPAPAASPPPAPAADPPPGDPFSESSGGPSPAAPPAAAEPGRQGPPSAPAPSDANAPTGLVERLPWSAYPEPMTRGLYGGSLWLDMQGHQWPYYPRTGVGVSGYAWTDTFYKYTRIGDPQQSPTSKTLFGQGRFALRLTPTYTNGDWFVQAQAEIVGNLNSLETQAKAVDTDDLWVRTGAWKRWDITVGRFEAFPVYHLGMGLDLHSDERNGAYDRINGVAQVPQPYLASYMYYRPQGPQNIAGHIYAMGGRLRLEALVQWGNDKQLIADVLTGFNVLGARAAAILDFGWIKFRYAHEYQQRSTLDQSAAARYEYQNRGGAGSVQLVFAPWIEFGPNFGKAITDAFTPTTPPDAADPVQSGDILSYGGFLNLRPSGDLLIGTGANVASFTSLNMNPATNEYDKSTNTQYFVAVQYLVQRQLFVKAVGGYAKTHFGSSVAGAFPYDDDQFSIRLRLMYLY